MTISRAKIKGAAQERGGKGIVDKERHIVGVGDAREFFNVQHYDGGIGDGLSEYGLGVGAELLLNLLLRCVGVHKGYLDPHALHGHGEEIDGTAIDGGGADKVISGA